MSAMMGKMQRWSALSGFGSIEEAWRPGATDLVAQQEVVSVDVQLDVAQGAAEQVIDFDAAFLRVTE